MNGAQVSTAARTGTVSDNNSIVTIGNHDDGVNNRYWNGMIDEVRLSNVARSADWIATDYANQNAPSTFHTLGAEEVLP
jgi:hypothetical protein